MADHTNMPYFKIENDSSVLASLDNFNEQDMVSVLTDETLDDPFSGDEMRDWYGTDAAQATPEERQAWKAAYEKLTTETAKIEATLEQARLTWEQAQGVAMGKLRDAYADYAPVHDAIEGRSAELHEKRKEIKLAEAKRKEDEARAKVKAEDEELGPRAWTINETTRFNHTVKKRPDMFIPVVHLAGCSATKGREDDRFDENYRRARAHEVLNTLELGGPLAKDGRPTKERAHAKLCGRCRPEASLREHLGEPFDKWLLEAESVQPPRLHGAGMPKAFGLQDQWHNYPSTPGYGAVNRASFQNKGLIEDHEAAVGWVDFDSEGKALAADSEKLKDLFQLLPPRGFAVRELAHPYDRDAGPCPWAVAVRRLTPHEIRTAKAAAREDRP